MQKALFSLLFSIVSVFILQAQQLETTAPSSSTEPKEDAAIRATTKALTEKYQLNADQAKQMYTIQVRKEKNLAQIEAFKDSDPALYRAKSSNIQKSTLANIRRILQTQQQVELYKKTQNDVRSLQNKKRKELAAQKADKNEVEAALLSIYVE